MLRPVTFRKKLRIGLLLVALVAVVSAVRPVGYVLWALYQDRGQHLPRFRNPRQVDDVSRLNPTIVQARIAVRPDTAGAIRQLVDLLRYAREHHLPVSVAGARHSMGGHTIAPGGLQVDMLPFKAMSLDTATHLLTVGAGAKWADVIPFLNRYGRAVATMQSDNAFSVGGSLSVNCHGWQHNKPPIAATVESLRLLRPDGVLVTCDRQRNPELFSLALGGYGLFGIILDARLRTVPNEIYTYHRRRFPAERYLTEYRRHIDQNPRARLVYGRLNINPAQFLQEATLNYFEYVRPAPPGAPLEPPGLTALKRGVFLASKEQGYGKDLRWEAEQLAGHLLGTQELSRNEIMNEDPDFYLNRVPGRTDILHEYFIPRRQFPRFVRELRRIVPRYPVDLLNVTLRNVYPDSVTYLRYAREEVFAFVMFFNQTRTDSAERAMTALTRELIDAAQRLGGTYYLPYRPHATAAQLRGGYPMADAFFRRKRQVDPDERFQNQFYQRYGRDTAAGPAAAAVSPIVHGRPAPKG